MTVDQARIIDLENQLASQSRFIVELSGKLSMLEEQNALLEKELSLYRHKKNSSNSSIPPSQDPFRVKQTESLRQRSGRKPGGQPGHEGFFLETVSDPTETVSHSPDYCKCCGKTFSAFRLSL